MIWPMDAPGSEVVASFPPPDLRAMDAPVRGLFEQVHPATLGAAPDLLRIAAAMVELARDTAYLLPRIEALGDRSSAVGLYAPRRGPRLMLVHRSHGQMGAIHDHGCWVGLAPITGVETHRRFRRTLDSAGIERLELATEQALAAGEAVTMLQPDDVHAHGHVAGVGDPAYLLIMTGDDQRRYHRTEWDARTGRARPLAPGDGGRWVDTAPIPGA